ncbi:MAG: oligosaccharide flippase family protein [Candidatus Pacearchaeota archaeon]
MFKKNNSTTTQKVLKNSIYNFLNIVVSRIGGLIFTVIIARFLFPELFGIYTLALTIILTIATFTDLGINSTLIRYLAESLKIKTKKTEIEARSRLYFLLNFKILFTAIAAFALFLLSNIISIYIFKKPSLILPLQLGSIYLFAISLQGFFSSIFYAIQKVKYTVIAETIFQILRIVLVSILFLFHKTVAPIFIILSISFFISFTFLWLTTLKKYSFLLKGPRVELEKNERKRLLSFFGWLTISSISLIFFAHIDTFMLGMFLPQAEFIGYYSAIFSIVGAVAAFVAFGSVLLPVFTQLEQGKLERGFKKVFYYTSLITIPAAIGLAFIIIPAIQIIYGQAYVPIQYKLAITITSIMLSFLVIETAFTTIYSALFQAKEKPKIPAILIIIITVINIILNYIFVKIGISIAPQYGLVGVALATFISRYGNLITLIILAKTRLNIKTNTSLALKPFIASLAMLSFLFIFNYFVKTSILIGILIIMAAVLVYFAALWIIKGLAKEDFELVKRIKD